MFAFLLRSHGGQEGNAAFIQAKADLEQGVDHRCPRQKGPTVSHSLHSGESRLGARLRPPMSTTEGAHGEPGSDRRCPRQKGPTASHGLSEKAPKLATSVLPHAAEGSAEAQPASQQSASSSARSDPPVMLVPSLVAQVVRATISRD